MTNIFAKIQKYIFSITLITSGFLGFSLAYLSSVVLRYFLHANTVTVAPVKKVNRVAEVRSSSFAEFEGIPTGNFVRDSGSNLSSDAPGENKENEDIVLVGLLAGGPSFARAAIQIAGKTEVDEYAIGENVSGYRIISIRSDSIIVDKNGNQFTIMLGGKSGEATQNPSTAEGGAGTGGTKTTISKVQCEKLLNDNKAMTSIRAIPYTHEGKMVGIKLHLVPSDHVFYKLGARSGDIIRRFNGDKLDNMKKMMVIYQSLCSLNRATVDLERGGKILTFEFIMSE